MCVCVCVCVVDFYRRSDDVYRPKQNTIISSALEGAIRLVFTARVTRCSARKEMAAVRTKEARERLWRAVFLGLPSSQELLASIPSMKWARKLMRAAIWNDDGDTVTALVPAVRGTVNARVKSMRLLTLAAMHGSIHAVGALLAAKADVHIPDTLDAWPARVRAITGANQAFAMAKCQAMYQAASGGHAAVVQLLIQAKADTDPDDMLLCTAVRSQDATAVSLLLTAMPRRVQPQVLRHAAKCSNVGILTQIIDSSADINVDDGDENGWTPLHHAVTSKHMPAVTALLRARACVDRGAVDRATPLFVAIMYSHEAAVSALIRAKACVDKARQSVTPLHQAVRGAQLPTVSALVVAKAHLDPLDSVGRTPLCLAYGLGHSDIAAYLVEAKASLDAVDMANLRVTTALHVAAQKADVHDVAALVNAKANIDATDEHGYTPLFVAVRRRNRPVIKHLVAAKACVHTRDTHYSITPVDYAYVANADDIVSVLLEAKARVDTDDDDFYERAAEMLMD